MRLTGEQLRAARAILQIDQITAASICNVSVETIKRLEKMTGGLRAQSDTTRKLIVGFERLGIEFIESGDFSPNGGPGVRLAQSRQDRVKEATLTILHSYVARSVDDALKICDVKGEDPNLISLSLYVQNLMTDAMNHLISDVDDYLDGRIVISEEDGFTFRTVSTVRPVP